jgi:hypothetical protein
MSGSLEAADAALNDVLKGGVCEIDNSKGT